MMSKGKLSGVGVGPGDPELLTLKAVRVIEEADVLVLPAEDKAGCRAYNIVHAAFALTDEHTDDHRCAGILEKKEYIFAPFPMSMSGDELHGFHERTAEKIARVLDEGKNAAFLTIGDPSVYSTLDYIAVILDEMGYETERLGGVTSFCAAADRLGISLGEGSEVIHIIPGSADIETALGMPGTKVFMKSGRRLMALKDRLIRYERETGCSVYGVLNCGLPGERLSYKAADIPDDWGYMAVIILRENG